VAAVLFALTPHFFELALHTEDALAHQAPVGLYLGLTWASCADATAQAL